MKKAAVNEEELLSKHLRPMPMDRAKAKRGGGGGGFGGGATPSKKLMPPTGRRRRGRACWTSKVWSSSRAHCSRRRRRPRVLRLRAAKAVPRSRPTRSSARPTSTCRYSRTTRGAATCSCRGERPGEASTRWARRSARGRSSTRCARRWAKGRRSATSSPKRGGEPAKLWDFFALRTEAGAQRQQIHAHTPYQKAAALLRVHRAAGHHAGDGPHLLHPGHAQAHGDAEAVR